MFKSDYEVKFAGANKGMGTTVVHLPSGTRLTNLRSVSVRHDANDIPILTLEIIGVKVVGSEDNK
jgi:hypothetical protein